MTLREVPLRLPPMASPRKARPPTVIRELRARIEALEERVARLEKGEAPPGDGRAAVRPARKGAPRCPGCGLELRRRLGRCVECGFPLPKAPRAPAET